MTSRHHFDLVDDLESYHVIAWLVPHKGERFDGAAFATPMPENKLLFVAARQDLPKMWTVSRL